MICTEDGHVNVSLSQDKAKCEHEKETKDCCKPVPAKQPETSSARCCDFNNTFLQLQESSLVYTPQTSTGHVLSSSLVLYAPPKVIAPLSHSCAAAPKAPPALCRKQHQQSITKVIRI
jgi:hypothetical protein